VTGIQCISYIKKKINAEKTTASAIGLQDSAGGKRRGEVNCGAQALPT
jgi:hypothetical protein